METSMTADTPEQIHRLIPHRDPMVMIDKYLRIDNYRALTQKTFTPDSYGCTGGEVMASVLIECVAQSVAAHHGDMALDKTHPPARGMLVSVDDFKFFLQVPDTATISIAVNKTNEIGPFHLIQGEISFSGKIAARGNIKIFNSTELPGEAT